MFESWNTERFNQFSRLIKRCLQRANLERFQILRVFKHGGSCLIPRLSQIIDEELTPAISVLSDSVSRGAAVYAGMRAGIDENTEWKKELELYELTPVISVGLHDTQVRKMVDRAYVPQSRFRVFSYTAPEACEARLNVYELDNKFVRRQNLIGGISLIFPQSTIRKSLSLVIFTVRMESFLATIYSETLDNRYSRLDLLQHYGDEGRPDQRNWLRALTPLDDIRVNLDSSAQTVDLDSEGNEVRGHFHNRTLSVEGSRQCGCTLYSTCKIYQSYELVLTVTPPPIPGDINTPPQDMNVPDLPGGIRDRPQEYREMIHLPHPDMPAFIEGVPDIRQHYTPPLDLSVGNLSRGPEIQPVMYNPEQYRQRTEAVPEIRRPDVQLQDPRAGYVSREPDSQPVMHHPQQHQPRTEAVPEIRRPDVPLQDPRAGYVSRETNIQPVIYNPQLYQRRTEAVPEIRRPDVPLQDPRAGYVSRETNIQPVIYNPQLYQRRTEAVPEIRRPNVPLQDVRAGYVSREPDIQPVMHHPQQYQRRTEAVPEIRRPDIPLRDVRAGYVSREPDIQPVMHHPQQYQRRTEAVPEIRRPDIPLRDVRAGYVSREPDIQPVMHHPQQYQRRTEAVPEIRRPDIPLRDVRAGYVPREPDIQPVMHRPQQHQPRTEAVPEIRSPDEPLQTSRAGQPVVILRGDNMKPVTYFSQEYLLRIGLWDPPNMQGYYAPSQVMNVDHSSRRPDMYPLIHNPIQDRHTVGASHSRPEVEITPVTTPRELRNPFTVPADRRFQSSIQKIADEQLPHEPFEAEPIVNLDPNTGSTGESETMPVSGENRPPAPDVIVAGPSGRALSLPISVPINKLNLSLLSGRQITIRMSPTKESGSLNPNAERGEGSDRTEN
ncbi:uncharacterized protein LOC124362200 isoform X2 [Homalodisca vitripennis]|uniref:uncharacterized protein LOC124362200 isoform X2 n=1 Tax=Homalodisca vitripennis TaxID=197043 RepID=UPI001EEC2E26|nr:uncharacterized protein LOC124362200 isoform X2 [Homalodisca vitripennis]